MVMKNPETHMEKTNLQSLDGDPETEFCIILQHMKQSQTIEIGKGKICDWTVKTQRIQKLNLTRDL